MTVAELMDRILPRMAGTKPVCSILDAVQAVHAIVVNRMILKRAELLRLTVKLDLDPACDAVAVPQGYNGMVQRPVLANKALTPLTFPVTDELLTPGQTRYYDVIGGIMSLYPPPAEGGSLTLKLYYKPESPSQLAGSIPFDGLFDDVYVQGTYAALIHGTAAVADRAFAAVIETQVDSVLQAANVNDEQMLADAINYH